MVMNNRIFFQVQILVSNKIFHRPDEAMLFVMVKACLHLKNIVSQSLDGGYNSQSLGQN